MPSLQLSKHTGRISRLSLPQGKAAQTCATSSDTRFIGKQTIRTCWKAFQGSFSQLVRGRVIRSRLAVDTVWLDNVDGEEQQEVLLHGSSRTKQNGIWLRGDLIDRERRRVVVC